MNGDPFVLDYDKRLVEKRMRRLLTEVQLKQSAPAYDWRLSLRRCLRGAARSAFAPVATNAVSGTADAPVADAGERHSARNIQSVF